MGKLFRGGSLSDTALLAREAVQNSSDAALRFVDPASHVPFRVVFRFVSLFGADKAQAVASLDLRGLATMRTAYPKDPLQPGTALDDLDDPKRPLVLLYVEDYGAHGLYGDPATFQASHLFKAMYYIGASTKASDAGGSFGFGKSALQRGSRTRSVIVHSVFAPFEDDPVSSRLVGFTWWPSLQVGKTMFDGRGNFAQYDEADRSVEGPAVPFRDADAEALAAQLGFQPRDPAKPEERGSSFLIVDPAIEPEDLIVELEKWWWPALEEHRLDIEVVLASGEVRVPKPASNPFVAQFLGAFRIATGLDEPVDPNRERLASKSWRNRSGSGGSDLGSLALVIPDAPVDEEVHGSEGTPLVALMRDPRMVIQYFAQSKRRIPIRGVFVASGVVNALLRETEPSSHDRWTGNSSGDLSQEATETARAVAAKIRHSVTEMAKDIAPPAPDATRALSHFSKLMKGFLGSKRGPASPPEPGGERIELRFPMGRPVPEQLDDHNVRLRTTFTARVADSAPGFACRVNVSCQLLIFEDDAVSRSRWPLSIEPAGDGHAFVREDDGSWSGVLAKTSEVVFMAVSGPYPNLWTTALQPAVTRLGDWSDE